jgi:hypothetical protein
MSTITLTRPEDRDDQIAMQWRGSDDGIVWTPWNTLHSARQPVDHHLYYQARVFIDGQWITSQIERDE